MAPDTFLVRLLYVIAPWTGAPLTGTPLQVVAAVLDRVGCFLSWVAAFLVNPASPTVVPPSWLPPWLVVAFAGMLTTYHLTHDATRTALGIPGPPVPVPAS